MSPQAAPTPETEPETPEKKQLRLTRIRALIQQASSADGDGQQAAWRVCALIRKFGLDIVDPDLIDTLHQENHQLKAQLEAAKAGMLDEEFGGFSPSAPAFGGFSTATSVNTGFTTKSTPASPAPPQSWAAFTGSKPPKQQKPQPPPPPPAAPAAQPVVPPPPPGTMTSPILMQQSKFEALCQQCSKRLHKGDPCLWMKGLGAWCPTTTCYGDWQTKNPGYGSPSGTAKGGGPSKAQQQATGPNAGKTWGFTP